MSDKEKEEKSKSRVTELLVGLGLTTLVVAGGGVATYMGIWDTYKTVELAKGRDVEKIKDRQQEKRYCGKIKDPMTNTTFYKCALAKLEEVRTGMLAGTPIEEFCGTEKEKTSNCPSWPKEERAACCCIPPLQVVDDCFCGTVEIVTNPETNLPEEREIFSLNDHGLLCRYGKAAGGEDVNCDPDDASLNCVSWPLEVGYGENPGSTAKQTTQENEGEE